ncbi:MAG: hypothetical protein WC389_08890 [Lutibacter sp.]|jgi:hypothetical protein
MITVSLETANLLKAAGWNKKTVFVWFKYLGTAFECALLDDLPSDPEEFYYTPTLEEILGELPKGEWMLDQYVDGKYNISYSSNNGGIIYDYDINNKSAVEAAAELWIKLNKKK